MMKAVSQVRRGAKSSREKEWKEQSPGARGSVTVPGPPESDKERGWAC